MVVYVERTRVASAQEMKVPTIDGLAYSSESLLGQITLPISKRLMIADTLFEVGRSEIEPESSDAVFTIEVDL